jgi:hypothetical protein
MEGKREYIRIPARPAAPPRKLNVAVLVGYTTFSYIKPIAQTLITLTTLITLITIMKFSCTRMFAQTLTTLIILIILMILISGRGEEKL